MGDYAEKEKNMINEKNTDVEMTIYDHVQIDPEFRTLLPEMSEGEYENLKADIRKNGYDVSKGGKIMVWYYDDEMDENDLDAVAPHIIVEGHHRFQACQELYAETGDDKYLLSDKCFEVMYFDNRDEVKNWMIKHQLSRRNMSKYARFELFYMLEGARLEEEADRRKKSNLRRGSETVNFVNTGNESITVSGELAKMVGTSQSTVEILLRIHKHYQKLKADNAVTPEIEQIIRDLRYDMISTNEAKNKLFPKKKRLQEEETDHSVPEAEEAADFDDAQTTEDHSNATDSDGAENDDGEETGLVSDDIGNGPSADREIPETKETLLRQRDEAARQAAEHSTELEVLRNNYESLQNEMMRLIENINDQLLAYGLTLNEEGIVVCLEDRIEVTAVVEEDATIEEHEEAASDTDTESGYKNTSDEEEIISETTEKVSLKGTINELYRRTTPEVKTFIDSESGRLKEAGTVSVESLTRLLETAEIKDFIAVPPMNETKLNNRAQLQHLARKFEGLDEQFQLEILRDFNEKGLTTLRDLDETGLNTFEVAVNRKRNTDRYEKPA